MKMLKEFALYLVVVLLAVIGLAISYYDYKGICEREMVIVLVGGCDQNGICGVKLNDGSFDKAKLPVVGQKKTISGPCK